jgi:hypothetical protein
MQSWIKIEYVVCAALLIAATAIGLFTRGAGADRGICLSTALQFADGDVAGCISQSEAKRLLDRTLALGDNREKDGVTLTHPKNMSERRPATTCRQYDELTSQGWYALTTYDMSMESFFRRECALIDALAKGMPARKSFVDDPRVGISDLDVVSALVLKGFVPTGAADATVGTLVRAGAVKVEEQSPRLLRLSGNGFTAEFEEMARGDFNGDGNQDIFVFSAIHAEGGTLRGYETRILSRSSATAPLTIVR